MLMQDHGGGTNVYGEVAKKLDAKYAPQGIHVYFCDEVYAKAQGDFDKWLVANGYPGSSHAGIPDTSEMWYLGGELGALRADQDGRGRHAPARARRAIRTRRASTTASPATPAGRARSSERRRMNTKVEYAVRQIQTFIPPDK